MTPAAAVMVEAKAIDKTVITLEGALPILQ